MKIGVIGIGMVGKAISRAFVELGYIVRKFDIKLPETKFEDTLDTDIIYICVPTKQNDDGSCDLTIVEETVFKLAQADFKGTVAIKSTVEPGTTLNLQNKYPDLELAHVPEFLRERCGYEDFTENHNVLIIGTDSDTAFKNIVKSHGHYPDNIINVTSTESELTKYFSNSYKALRTIFSSSFGKICDHLGADYNKVLKAFLLENVEPKEYLKYSSEFKGFSGSCLPKDVSALNFFVNKENLDIDVFNFTIDENKKF